MKTISHRCRGTAFSLVEVVVAIAIFSFCVVSIIYLLAVALESSHDSRQDSAMAAILQNTVSQMVSIPSATLTNLPTTNFYFDLGGSITTAAAADKFYRATVNRVSGASVTALTSVTDGALVSPGVTNADNHFLWVLLVAYPGPAYTHTNSFLFGHSLMGSVTNNFRE